MKNKITIKYLESQLIELRAVQKAKQNIQIQNEETDKYIAQVNKQIEVINQKNKRTGKVTKLYTQFIS